MKVNPKIFYPEREQPINKRYDNILAHSYLSIAVNELRNAETKGIDKDEVINNLALGLRYAVNDPIL